MKLIFQDAVQQETRDRSVTKKGAVEIRCLWVKPY